MEVSKELQRIARLGNNISREFNPPLQVLISTLEAIEKLETDETKKLQLKVALRNAYKFRALTQDVFTLSKLLSFDVVYYMSKIDVVQFLEQTLNSFKPAADKKNVALVFRSNVADLYAFIDFQKLHKIVYKLIANGIRFMKAGGGTVQLSLFYQGETEKLKIEVWDDGIGIIPEKVPHLFDLYYEKDPIHLMYYQGTGIGLHLTKQLIEALDGQIHVESTKFKYTKFQIQLPLFFERQDINFTPVEIVEDADISQLATSEMVAAVDTDEILQVKLPSSNAQLVVVVAQRKYESFWQQVWAENVEMVYLNNIDEALGEILSLVPEMIIIQNELDGISGTEALAYLRKMEQVGHIPIVLFCPNNNISKKEIQLLRADEVVTDVKHPEQVYIRLHSTLKNRQEVFKAAYKSAVYTFKSAKALSPDESFITKVNNLIDKNISDPKFNVERLSEAMNLSRTQIYRKLNTLTGMSTSHYISHYKLSKAYKDLETHSGNISQISDRYGFSSLAYFSRLFSRVFGIKPSEVGRNVE